MLCPNCGKKLAPNKGWGAQFYDGYCNHCDMPIEDGVPEKIKMKCNPDICPNCIYIGDGDSMCGMTNEIVLSGWEPTEEYMGEGCPFRKRPARTRCRKKNVGGGK